MQIILWGYMGSGKTSVGKRLAQTLQYSFLDLDNEIEKEESLSISELFKIKGEIYFRKKENEIVKKIIASNNKCVLSLGGGTPVYNNLASYLSNQQNTTCIYLSAHSQTLTTRLFNEKNKRPLLNYCETPEQLNDFIRKHLFERNIVYNTANIIVKVDNLDIKKIVEKIVIQLF